MGREIYIRQHVMAGPGSFVLPALGYSDFERAIRQKFVIEMSGIAPPRDRTSIASAARQAGDPR